MARLLKKNGVGEPEVLELSLGVNRFGRHPENHFTINHSTVSARHCEIILTAEAVLLRDCDSTNGTFINDAMVREAVLQPGQILRLGDVEFLVDTTEVTIAIPAIDRPRPAPPPVVLPDGAVLCPRHTEARVTHRCTQCHAVLCDTCVTRLRRRGGKALKLCALCSHPVEPFGVEKPRKRNLLALLQKTIKLPFARSSRKE